MASQPTKKPDTITPQSPDEAPAKPGFTEAPLPPTQPEAQPDEGGDIIDPGSTPDEVPPQVSHPGTVLPD